MSNPPLPEELLDDIVDLLHDSKDALRSCCLVSKSWIPCTRKFLFARIVFWTPRKLRLWINTFPDPSTSPAYYTRTLVVGCPEIARTEDAGEGGWIRTFSRIMHLRVDIPGSASGVPEIQLSLFRGLSPFVQSIRIASNYLLPQTFDLVYSFPLLEDLSVVVSGMNDGSRCSGGLNATQPSSPPVFTGTLRLSINSGIDAVALTLLSLPSGLHFRKLDLRGGHENTSTLTTALIESCCDTLESIRIREPVTGLVDLSKATKLKDVKFKTEQNPQTVVAALRTITKHHQNLRQISISTNYIILNLELRDIATPSDWRLPLQNANVMWLKLDCLLAQLWESHSVRLEIAYYSLPWLDEGRARSCMRNLLPELMMRGAVDLVEKVF